MTANNIIRGPWVGNDPTPVIVSSTLANAGVNQIKANHINDTLVALMPMIFHNIELAGFCCDDASVDDTLKDGTLIVESVKSMLFKHYSLHHPLQDVAEALYIPREGSSNANALDYVDHIDLDIDEPEQLVVFADDDDMDEDEDALEE